jgi:hypothetical protein
VVRTWAKGGRTAAGFADSLPWLYAVGAAWFAIFGTWYVFGTWPPPVRRSDVVVSGRAVDGADRRRAFAAVGTDVVAAAQDLQPSAGRRDRRGSVRRVGINAVSRQVVQNIELRGYYDVLAQPTSVEWGPLVMFLVTFVSVWR